MSYLTLTPAYGRDYRSQKAVRADWLENKDFVIATLGHPTYINKRDADREGTKVMIRYSNLTKITNI